MKRLFLFLIVFVQAIVGFAENWVDFAEQPATTPEGVYVITKATELAWVAKKTQTAEFSGSLIINNDIDLSGKQWTPLGYNGSTADGATGFYYNGSIDGQGHTISGLDIQTGADDFSAGFIGGTNNKNAVIKNINIAGTMTINNTSKEADFGSLIGFANAMSSVENCHSSVTILCNGASVGSYLGGLVGRMKATNIVGCSYTGSISVIATSNVVKGLGGILGSPNSGTSNAKGSLRNSVFAGSINVDGTIGSSGTAALVGYANLSKGVFTIANNYVNGTMTFNTVPSNCAVIVGKATKLGTNTVLGDNYIVQSTGLTDSKATIVTDEQLYGGELCWLLNGGQHNFTQDLSVEKSVPMPKAGEKVYKTIFMNDGETYATSFNNATISFPANPADIVTKCFVGWTVTPIVGVSDVAPEFVSSTTIATNDLILYAVFAKKHEDTYSEYCTTVAVPATITETGFATFCCDYALDLNELPEGLTAYYATYTTGASTILMKVAEGKVPTGTGLFLKGTAETSYKILVAATGTTIDDNILEPTDGTELPIGTYVYMKADGMFHPLGTALVVSKGKAYIPAGKIEAEQPIGISFEGELTGINSVYENVNENENLYNLQGIRVTTLKKGEVYIMNGKKFLMK